MTKKQRIIKHGNDLIKIFPHAMIKDPEILYRELRKVEKNLHKLAEDSCNFDVEDAHHNRVHLKAYARINQLLRPYETLSIEFNGDPRGYALKLSPEYMSVLKNEGLYLITDMGGYGLLAPEFSSVN